MLTTKFYTNIPNAVKDKLIFCVSTSVSPSAPDIATLSLPAKSTR